MKRKRDTKQKDETDSLQTQILLGERWVVPDVTSSRAGLAIQISAYQALNYHTGPPW